MVVTATTEHRASRRILTSPHLRIAGADQVQSGVLIVSALQAPGLNRLPQVNYFASGLYPADPAIHNPTPGCGACSLPEFQGPNGTVVLATGYPWDTCAPWPADEPILILPLHRTPRRSPCPST